MIVSGLLAAVCGLSVGVLATGWWLQQAIVRQTKRRNRLEAVRREAVEHGAEGGDETSADLRMVASIGMLLSRSGLLPSSTMAELTQTLAAAGMRQQSALAIFIGGKLLLVLLLPAVAWLFLPHMGSSAMRLMLIAASAVAGLLLPDMIVQRRRSTYLNAVARGLPDALDMLVICSEAGLGLEMGLERVSVEIAPAHPQIAAELKVTCNELRILAERRMALANMGSRTGLEVLKRLGGTLIQTLQYGTPLSQALRTLATEMRYEMLMRFEAQAARLPVLLTMPMILFILPCIFIVVGGPAGMTVARTFMHH